MDRDGHTDVVTGVGGYRIPGKPSGDWTRQDLGQPLYNMAAVFDFDFDGDFDVLGTAGKASDPNSTFVWARNNGDGSFRILKNVDQAEGDFLQGIDVGDLRGEGTLSVALSWYKADNGIQLLSVPANPAKEQWTWQRISDYSQDEQMKSRHPTFWVNWIAYAAHTREWIPHNLL